MKLFELTPEIATKYESEKNATRLVFRLLAKLIQSSKGINYTGMIKFDDVYMSEHKLGFTIQNEEKCGVDIVSWGSKFLDTDKLLKPLVEQGFISYNHHVYRTQGTKTWYWNYYGITSKGWEILKRM